MAVKKATTKKKSVKKKLTKRTTSKRVVSAKDVKSEQKVAKKSISKVEKRKEPKIVYAKAKYIRSSAQKARLVIDLIRKKGVLDSLARLEYVQKKAALPIRKTLESALANAKNNFEMDEKKLVVVEARVDDAPIFKRGRAGSRGRYKKILKRNCHIIIGVTEL